MEIYVSRQLSTCTISYAFKTQSLLEQAFYFATRVYCFVSLEERGK